MNQSTQLRHMRAILCMALSLAMAAYLLFWFFLSINQKHMGDVAEWGAAHNVLSWQIDAGPWVAPGLLWNPQNPVTYTGP